MTSKSTISNSNPHQRYFSDLILELMLRPSSGWFTTFTNKLRHRFWVWVYSILSKTNDDGLQFINYGYVPDDGVLVQLTDDDNALDGYAHVGLQLYHEVANTVPIKDKNVIEIACGRGGGSLYIARYLQPKTMTGIDLCVKSINFANKVLKPKCQMNNLHFQVGNAMDLVDIPSNVYDVVVNVESSHCYPNFSTFMMEVYRILKPGGYCVLCDMRVAQHIQHMENDMVQTGFIIQQNVNITENVLKGLKVCSVKREAKIKAKLGVLYSYSILGPLLCGFAGVEGSVMYEYLEAPSVLCKRYVLQKPE
jgi:ubiquinone/menaquinone biosynthesis C-methylase UbiE